MTLNNHTFIQTLIQRLDDVLFYWLQIINKFSWVEPESIALSEERKMFV